MVAERQPKVAPVGETAKAAAREGGASGITGPPSFTAFAHGVGDDFQGAIG